jgi:hypothetical protein
VAILPRSGTLGEATGEERGWRRNSIALAHHAHYGVTYVTMSTHIIPGHRFIEHYKCRKSKAIELPAVAVAAAKFPIDKVPMRSRRRHKRIVRYFHT